MIRALVALGRSTSAAAERVEGVEFDAAHCDERFVLHAVAASWSPLGAGLASPLDRQPLERGNIPKNATKRPRLAKLVVELEPHELDYNLVKLSRGCTCGAVGECAEKRLDLAEEAVVFPDRELEQIAQ